MVVIYSRIILSHHMLKFRVRGLLSKCRVYQNTIHNYSPALFTKMLCLKETSGISYKMEESFDDKCIFCRIVKERSSEFFYEDDDFVSFKDIKPAAQHHYLIIPKKHIKNPSTLKKSDVDLVKKLLSIGEEVLRTQNADLENVRYGYHWPPFNSVQHLHMHAISPTNEMSFVSRIIFKPDSYWFVNASTFIEKLEKMDDES